jgi:hypothetical protein
MFEIPPSPKPTTKYYKYTEPVSPVRPLNSELWSYEYKTFLITRASSEYLFWTIEMPDRSKPPIPLRSSYTHRQMAEKAIDDFIAIETKKQEASE